MKRFLALDRPLAVFDIESTGLNPRVDRIVEIAVVRLEPDGTRKEFSWRLNPTVQIPPETTAVHGITDEMVASAPTFADKAREIMDAFEGCDLGGFGLSKLDIPILDEEFARCGMRFNPNGRRMFDALRVYHAREPRDLTAALRFYCGEDLVGAHGAAADAGAALRVLEGEFAKYGDLPEDPDAFDRTFNPRDPSFVDREGRFRKVDGAIVVNFGKNKGRKLDDLAAADPSYLRWIVNGDFPHDAKEVAREAIKERRRREEAAKAAREAGRRRDAPERDRPRQERPRRPGGEAPVPPGFEGFAAALSAALGENAQAKGKGR